MANLAERAATKRAKRLRRRVRKRRRVQLQAKEPTAEVKEES